MSDNVEQINGSGEDFLAQATKRMLGETKKKFEQQAKDRVKARMTAAEAVITAKNHYNAVLAEEQEWKSEATKEVKELEKLVKGDV